MKKKILTATSLLCFILMLILSTGCNQNSYKTEGNKSDSLKEAVNDQPNSSGEKWLKSIFQCNNGSDYCFPNEEKVCTKRYYEYFVESLGIYEYPDFETDNEQVAAEKAFKNKWKDIYPQDAAILSPFGRGNGVETGMELKNVNIIFHSDYKYTVVIDYSDGIKTTSEVTLIANGNSFLIDYMKSEYIE